MHVLLFVPLCTYARTHTQAHAHTHTHTHTHTCTHMQTMHQVTGVFLESASPEEQAAAQKVAREQPAGSVADLEAKGISFATSRM